MSRHTQMRTPRWLRRIGKRVFRGTDAYFERTSLIGTTPVLDATPFPFARELETAYPAITE